MAESRKEPTVKARFSISSCSLQDQPAVHLHEPVHGHEGPHLHAVSQTDHSIIVVVSIVIGRRRGVGQRQIIAGNVTCRT